jgi:short-subunit dehydrogenase
MEAMRYSVAPDNIKVAIVNPGPVSTGFINRYKREEAEITLDGREPATLVSKMSERYSNALAGRLAVGQSKESCAESIVDVIEREYPKRVDEGQASVRFWNGTSDSAENIIAAVKCDVTGCESAVYRDIWKSSLELADAVRREADDE